MPCVHSAKCCLTRVDSSHRLQKNAHRDSVEDGLGSIPSKNGRLGFIAQAKTAASSEQLKLPDFAEVEMNARSWWSYSAFSGAHSVQRTTQTHPFVNAFSYCGRESGVLVAQRREGWNHGTDPDEFQSQMD